MHPYADTPSQQARQFAATTAQDSAEETRRCAESAARIRAAHQARQNRRAERRALEAANNFAAIKTGTDYERFVANLLATGNIPTVRVGGTGDYGADLLAQTPIGPAVIQCKFYTHPVGYDAVQQAYTAKALYKATAAYVVTNATYTPQARRAARRLGVTLTNHAEIAAVISDVC